MAETKLSDVSVPELFNPYVVNRTMELSALVQSGIVINNPEFDRLASQASPLITMPFYEDLTGASEPVSYTHLWLKIMLMSRGYVVEDKRSDNLLVVNRGNITNYFYILAERMNGRRI